MKKNLFILVSITLGLCACNLDEPLTLNDTPETTTVYHMIIPASFDAQTKGVTFDPDGSHISTQFETTDKIYVYNETKGAFARSADGEHPLSYLSPSASGSTCTLEGELSFYKLNVSDEWESVAIEEGDTYNLFYQMNDPDYVYPGAGNIPRFDYSQQDGSASGASSCDFAEATGVTMSLSGTTLTVPDGIQFKNMQSMFRQRLSFTKDGVAVTPTTITKLNIGTRHKTYLEYYRPDRPDLDGDNGVYLAFDSFDILNPVISLDGDIFLSLAFYYTVDEPADGDRLILTAIDNEGNVYQCTKKVPSGGFQRSKYYHGNSELVWKYQIGKPVVTRSDGGDINELEPDYDGEYDITGDPAIITICGDSQDHYFCLDEAGVVTLTGDGMASSTMIDNNDYLYANSDLTIILESDYSIIWPKYDTAIWSENGDLKLKTTGGVQTLSVTVKHYEGSYPYYGIYGDSNYWRNQNVADLAVDGYSVSRTGGPDANGITDTWTYTVTPNPHTLATITAGDVGNVIGADGIIYASISAATTAGTTAEAMIAFVGGVDGICEHGLAISLTDIENYQMDFAAATGDSAIPVWAIAHSVTDGTWRLPSKADWQYMLSGSGYSSYFEDIITFQTKLTAVGTALPNNAYFWTSTEDNDISSNAYALYMSKTSAGLNSTAKTQNWHVRACLSF